MKNDETKLDEAIKHCEEVIKKLGRCKCKEQHEFLLCILKEKKEQDKRTCGNCELLEIKNIDGCNVPLLNCDDGLQYIQNENEFCSRWEKKQTK